MFLLNSHDTRDAGSRFINFKLVILLHSISDLPVLGRSFVGGQQL